MQAVMIRCPITGQPVPTGLQADRGRFGATAVFFARVQCPRCNSEHEWFARDAWVSDAPGEITKDRLVCAA